MGTSPFEIGRQQREQNLKPAASLAPAPDGIQLPAPKPRRKQYSVYLDVEMMELVKRVAHQREVTIGAVIESCLKMTLEQLEN